LPLTRDFDEDVSITDWTRDGIWFGAAQHTATALFHLDPTRLDEYGGPHVGMP